MRHDDPYALVDSRGAQRTAGPKDSDWFRPRIDREILLSLMKRSNSRTAIDLMMWILLLVAFGSWLIISWFSIWTLPAALGYGVLYGSAADARWHEFGHRTAFASKRANDVVYHFASFMVLREPVSWRWSHARHHSETIFVGRDPEIAFPRPMPVWKIALETFGLISAFHEMRKYFSASIGRMPAAVASYVPQREHRRVIFWSRVHLSLLLFAIFASIGFESVLPVVLVGMPSLYGRWLLYVLGSTQHAGLKENVLDHRENTRSVEMGRIMRFLYLNMNFHLEHHLFPSVPYHRLPDLSEQIRSQLPQASPSLPAALVDVRRRLRTIREQNRKISKERVGQS